MEADVNLLSAENQECDMTDTAPPTKSEINDAVKRLQNGKAGGLDGVTAECLKAGGESVVNMLHCLFAVIWTSMAVPSGMKDAIVIPVFKEKD